MIKADIGMAGLYRFEAFKQDAAGNEIPGTRRVVADWFPNLITDVGMRAHMADGTGDLVSSCHVGSGSAPPVPSDTALAAFVAYNSSSQSHTIGFSNAAPYYGWRRQTFRFNAGVAAGNLSEVGAYGSAGLYSRALIKDSSGNPITITVLSDEVLDVTYELRVYAPTSDSVYNVTDSGSGIEYTFTVRASGAGTRVWCGQSTDSGYIGKVWRETYLRVGPATSGLVPITGEPAGLTAGLQTYSGWSAVTQDGGSFTASRTVTAGLTYGNVAGGIGVMTFGDSGGGVACGWLFQAAVSPAIAKDATKTLSLTFAVTITRYEL